MEGKTKRNHKKRGFYFVKKYLIWIGVLIAIFLLIQRPKYWESFREDKSNYNTVTFYWVIKEEILPAGGR